MSLVGSSNLIEVHLQTPLIRQLHPNCTQQCGDQLRECGVQATPALLLVPRLPPQTAHYSRLPVYLHQLGSSQLLFAEPRAQHLGWFLLTAVQCLAAATSTMLC